jgi:adenylate cyclase
VVERDGDLLGDGVNIAARLEGLAEIGGICISRAVHEQVANKLSARFIDIGARQVKNIPAPVHAYVVVTWDEGRSDGTPQATAAGAKPAKKSTTKWLSAALIGAVALCTAAFALLSVSQKLDNKASLGPSAAAALPPVTALPPVSTTPAPASSSPPKSSTPVPTIRRTSSAMNESDATRRSHQFCMDLATQRGWRGTVQDLNNGQRDFIAACMQGGRN